MTDTAPTDTAPISTAPEADRSDRGRQWPVWLLLAAALVVLVNTAWLSEDAYITFRSVDNWIHGYGLTWNVAERVQSYTHPLWMLVVTAARLLTGELYLTITILSIGLAMATLVLLALHVARSQEGAILTLLLLLLCKSFIDFSTSGLENPLSHLLLVLLLLVHLRISNQNQGSRPREQLALWLLAGLVMLNRQDLSLVVLPVLGLHLVRNHRWPDLARAVIGLAPVACWYLFALLYYGFLFPNTAYAKLNTAIPTLPLLIQGLHYLADSLHRDPLTLTAIIASLVLVLGGWCQTPVLLRPAIKSPLRGCRSPLILNVSTDTPAVNGFASDRTDVTFLRASRRREFNTSHLARRRRAEELVIAAGILLYLVYLLRIGGDCFSGRFLAAPLVCACVLLARVEPWSRRWWWPAVAATVLLGLLAENPTVLSGPDYGRPGSGTNSRSYHGISDTRADFYPAAGLLPVLVHGGLEPFHDLVEAGRSARRLGPHTGVRPAIGFFGYYAGPEAHIIDQLALTEPLLARLPARDVVGWYIGHFARRLPEGYWETVSSGHNQLMDRRLGAYYDHLCLVLRGDLLDSQRLREIWRLNTGAYNHLLAFELQTELAWGQYYLEQQQPEQAIAAIERAIAQQPDRAACWFYLAQALAAAGRDDEATAAADQARSLGLAEPWLQQLQRASTTAPG